MRKHFLLGHGGAPSDDQGAGKAGPAAVWLRIPDLRGEEEDVEKPIARKHVGLLARARDLLHKPWQTNRWIEWRAPPGLILGGGATMVIVMVIMMSGGDEKQPEFEVASTSSDWNAPAAENDWGVQDYGLDARAQYEEPQYEEPQYEEPQYEEVAQTSPWPRRSSSPQQPSSGLSAPGGQTTPGAPSPSATNRAPAQNVQTNAYPPPSPYHEQRVASRYPTPGHEAVSPPSTAAVRPPIMAEFEGTIERPQTRAQHEHHRSSFH